MKRSQTETSALYRSPHPGELKDRLTFRTREDVPAPGGGTQPVYTGQFQAWGKVRQVSGSAYLHSMQIGEQFTHVIVIRRRDGVTSDSEILLNGQVFRVMRVGFLNDGRRFLRIDAKELGAEAPDDPPLPGKSTFYGGYGGT